MAQAAFPSCLASLLPSFDQSLVHISRYFLASSIPLLRSTQLCTGKITYLVKLKRQEKYEETFTRVYCSFFLILWSLSTVSTVSLIINEKNNWTGKRTWDGKKRNERTLSVRVKLRWSTATEGLHFSSSFFCRTLSLTLFSLFTQFYSIPLWKNWFGHWQRNLWMIH